MNHRLFSVITVHVAIAVILVGVIFSETVSCAPANTTTTTTTTRKLPPNKVCHFPTQRADCGTFSCDPIVGRCARCRVDTDCFEQAMICDADTGTCSVANFFDSRTFGIKSIATAITALVTCIIGLIAGVGGGGILVPLYSSLGGLPVTQSRFVSLATVVGQSVVNIPVVLAQRDPAWPSGPGKPTRPLAALDVTALWYPLAGAGTIVGQLLGRLVPSWMRMVLLFLLASYLTWNVVGKALRQRKEDTEKAAAAKAAKEAAPAAAAPSGVALPAPAAAAGDATVVAAPPAVSTTVAVCALTESSTAVAVIAPTTTTIATTDAAASVVATSPTTTAAPASPSEAVGDAALAAAAANPDSISRWQPTEMSLLVLVVACGAVVSQTAMSSTSELECGGSEFASLIMTGIIFQIGVAWLYRRRMEAVAEAVAKGEKHPIHLSLAWNFQNSVVLPALCCLAGIGSSLLGIGGGMVANPLLLEAGLSPERVSATGSLMTGFVATQSLITAISGDAMRPPTDMIAVYTLIGFLSTLAGRFWLIPFIRKMQATWLIVAALAFILAATLLSTVIVGAENMIELHAAHAGLGFGSLCPPKKNATAGSG